MNARLKLFFLANLSRQKIGSDRGFALPMALMVGMVILVVGVTMIIRAQSDQSKVISQVQTSQADAIAEAGATRYMDFLNRHPVLLSAADHTKWSDQWTKYIEREIDGTGQPGGSDTPQSGATCQDTNLDSAGNAVGPSNPDGVTSTQITETWANTLGNGQEVNNGQGKFKLVGYKYDSATKTAALGIQGIVGAGSAGQATSQVKYTFQIGQKQSTPASPSPSGTPIIPQTNPGLWARSFTGTDKQVA
jgi:hypothetical protein